MITYTLTTGGSFEPSLVSDDRSTLFDSLQDEYYTPVVFPEIGATAYPTWTVPNRLYLGCAPVNATARVFAVSSAWEEVEEHAEVEVYSGTGSIAELLSLEVPFLSAIPSSIHICTGTDTDASNDSGMYLYDGTSANGALVFSDYDSASTVSGTDYALFNNGAYFSTTSSTSLDLDHPNWSVSVNRHTEATLSSIAASGYSAAYWVTPSEATVIEEEFFSYQVAMLGDSSQTYMRVVDTKPYNMDGCYDLTPTSYTVGTDSVIITGSVDGDALDLPTFLLARICLFDGDTLKYCSSSIEYDPNTFPLTIILLVALMVVTTAVSVMVGIAVYRCCARRKQSRLVMMSAQQQHLGPQPVQGSLTLNRRNTAKLAQGVTARDSAALQAMQSGMSMQQQRELAKSQAGNPAAPTPPGGTPTMPRPRLLQRRGTYAGTPTVPVATLAPTTSTAESPI
ncbi:hypothetical protein KIPB_003559 [Kipferlia bialata]|uniref:Uncharacterized protein n=1 Tax=Kipferlia bialata TaxID=797122 RepID=A0A9K3GGR1_9EUKA|nr:hypothetical protein KIPB_003559 [Kipferlia bialata]|eukprot:g3559.t1